MKWVNQVRMYFGNLKISVKLMLFYLGLLMFSLLLSSVVYQKIYSSIMSAKVGDVAMQTLASVSSNLDAMLENAKNLSRVVLSSDEIQRALGGTGSDDGSQPAASPANELDIQRRMTPYVSRFIDAFPFISSIYLFDMQNHRYGIDRYPQKSLKVPDIRNAEWFGEAEAGNGSYLLRLNGGDAFNDPSGQRYVSLIRMVNDIYTQKPIGVLVLNISEASFVEAYQNITNTYDTDILITDGEGQTVVNFRNPAFGGLEGLAGSHAASTVAREGGKDYLISRQALGKYNWKVISVMPFDELSGESRVFSVAALGMILLNSLLLFAGSILVSRTITTPVRKLIRSMEGVEKGRLHRVELVAGSFEIGQLRDSFNRMVTEIEMLIERVVEDQKLKRKAELDVLQAQIKPHFLYNTFDAISALALAGRNDDVYKVMKALGSYYRASLNKGNEVITIGEELEVVRSYLTIQQVRYGEVFSVVYDVEDSVRQVPMLKLVLQPLVENALYHGIKPKGERGRISVTARRIEDVVVLKVEDDGVGMTQEILEGVMSGNRGKTRASVGLRGTIDRLRIFYGDNDLMTVDSAPGEGTRVVITIPVSGGEDNHG